MISKRSHKTIVLSEIIIMVLATIATSYIIYESSKSFEGLIIEDKKEFKIKLFSMYKTFVELIIGDRGFVSAESSVYTCVLDKNGSICQEYPILKSGDIQKCNNACSSECLPSTKDKIDSCKLGVCYDSLEGVCLANSPKAQCQNTGGVWKADSFANIAECQRGCCFVGEQTFFATNQECKRKGQVLGINTVFKSEIRTELACLVESKTQEMGACVFEQDFENTCKFSSRAQCVQMRGSFYSGYLCSNPELKTNCKPQKSTGCVDGKDGIYWFDSCGNPENIYDANKVKSYNDGKVASESCAIGTSDNPLANQETCGNCNYLLGSRCGAKTSSEKLADSTQDFVCRDLSCTDSQGNKRTNGESWCAYQGAIGTDVATEGLFRSVDTPGSRHFRQSCIDGEVQTDACADYRNEICVEAKSPLDNGKTFSSAACRLNRWQQCIEYNSGSDLEGNMEECKKNDDCFVKEVALSESFRFKMCAPKYPSGFDLKTNAKSAQGICRLVDQKCTVIYVKGWGGWECKANCDCESKAFAEQMNDLCMSLGDCGTSANYIGDVTNNIKVKNSPELDSDYLNKLKKYKEPVKGKVANPGNLTNFYGEVGIPEGLGSASYDPEKANTMMGMIAGAAGVGLIFAANQGWLAGTFLGHAGAPAIPAGTNIYGYALPNEIPAMSPGLEALGGAMAGAAIGFAVVNMLIGFLVPGMDQSSAMALSIAGAVGGAMLGANLVGGASATFGWIGGITLAIVIAVIIIAAILGVGEKKEIIVEFKCKPWQAPVGGAKCNQCGSDNGNAFPGSSLGCSAYACRSLGQTCEFMNEGTGKELCVDVNPKDVTSPVISPLQGILQNGSSYDKVSASGFSVKGPSEEGCFKSYSTISLGVELDEPGQCRFDVKHTNKFEDMEEDFDDGLFLYNHSVAFSVPSLESLGLQGYDPNRKADYNLYLRCRDKRGNANVAEYTINFCIKPGNDLTPPIINAREPVSEWVKYNSSVVNATIYTNEPAECKWSKQDIDYDLMNNSMNCDYQLTHQQIQGWKCSAMLPVDKNDDVAFIRCKDQPWLMEDGGQKYIVVNEGQDAQGNQLTKKILVDAERTRNKNTESYNYVMKKSESELRINSVKPNNEELVFGVEPATVDLEVQTIGGVDGNAICSYLWGGNLIPFYETTGNIHRQQLQSFFSGEKQINIQCEDEAGNIANAQSNFSVKIDREVPLVTRVFNRDGSLYLVTNEPAECSYSLSDCGFDFANGTIMAGSEFVHTGAFSQTQTTYVKCKDPFGNLPGGCSIKIRSN